VVAVVVQNIRLVTVAEQVVVMLLTVQHPLAELQIKATQVVSVDQDLEEAVAAAPEQWVLTDLIQ
jgi:hypothetical protein